MDAFRAVPQSRGSVEQRQDWVDLRSDIQERDLLLGGEFWELDGLWPRSPSRVVKQMTDIDGYIRTVDEQNRPPQ